MGGVANLRSELQSVAYVDTTIASARQFFAVGAERYPDVVGDAPAWAFVAYGRFQYFCMGCAVHESPVSTTLVLIIPKSGGRYITAGGDQQYDLTALGTPYDAPKALMEQICDERVNPAGQQRVCGVYAGDH
jgi:hypothetical protein